MLPPIFEVKIDLGLCLLYTNEIYFPLGNYRNRGIFIRLENQKLL